MEQAVDTTRRSFGTRIQASLGYVAFIQAFVATAGSLYFSEVMGYLPCALCWYQRILMYPLVLVIGVGLLLRDRRLPAYALPLSVLGFVISLYHNLLQYNVISDGSGSCTGGVPCTTLWINWFGFVTIPLLALIAFGVITLSLLIYQLPADKTDA